MRAVILSVCLAMVAGAAGAQTVNEGTAKGQLFGTRGTQLAFAGSLSEQDRAILQGTVKELDRTGQPFRFYGSIAYSPSEGLTAQSLRGATNYHSTAASDSAALAACNAARGSGSSACVVAAQILPKGYEPGRFQLSYDATNAFNTTYRKVRGPKSLAISPGTTALGMGKGDRAASTAVELCNREARNSGPADCVAVIVDQ